MDQEALQIRRSQWERIIIEGNKATISKKEWCKQNGISEKSFYYWQRKIRKQATKALETSKAVPVPAPCSAFVELPFPSVPQSFREPVQSPGVPPELIIQVGDCRIYVTGAVQEHTLCTVMKVIRNA